MERLPESPSDEVVRGAALVPVPATFPTPSVEIDTDKQLAGVPTIADSLTQRVWKLEATGMLVPAEGRAREKQIDGLKRLSLSLAERSAIVKMSQPAAPDTDAGRAVTREVDAIAKETAIITSSLTAVSDDLGALETTSGWTLIDKLLSARCSTAICFDNGTTKHWLGIEPLVELPIGISFGVNTSGISDYINNHELRVDLAAGARVWLFRDIISISIYISKPLIDSSVRLGGSDFVYPGASVRRPFPGFALGLLFDSIWLSFDRNELRNGDGKDGSAFNPDFPPNTLVSSGWTITLALQPVTAFRTAIGTAVEANKAGQQ